MTNATEPLAVYEAVWELRLRAFGQETSAALQLIAQLCADQLTAQAVFRGEEAARAEVLRVFVTLGRAQQRFASEFEPAPTRFAARAALCRQAFDALAAAGKVYVNASGPVIDLDGIDQVNEQLRRAGRLFAAAATDGTNPTEPEEATAPKPTPRRRPKSPRATDD